MATTIQLRRGSASQWATTNPILRAGEPGVALDTHLLKIGDGVTPWASLVGVVDGLVLTSDARLSDARVPVAHTQAFSTLTGLPSTLAGYGIPAVTKADVGLGNVENTALSTWAGSANLTTIGQLASLKVGGATPPTGVEGYFATTSASDPRGLMSAQYSTDATGARLHLRKGRGTEAAPTTIVTGDVLGRVRFSGYDSANYLQSGSIDVVSTGTIAATRVPSYLAFSVATDATPSVLTEVLRLNAPNATGIGILTVPLGTNLGVNILRATTPDGSWGITYGAVTNPFDAARKDESMDWGWNPNAATGRLDAAEPGWVWRLENYYTPDASQRWMESHLQYISADGTVSRRPWACVMNRATHISGVAISTTTLSVCSEDTLTAYEVFTSSGITFQNNAGILLSQNNLQLLRQRNAANTAYITIGHVNATNQVELGVNSTGVAIRASLYVGSITAPKFTNFADQGLTFESAAGAGAYLLFKEMADPGVAPADGCKFYIRDNGSGKTQLVVLFSSGAVQVIATQP